MPKAVYITDESFWTVIGLQEYDPLTKTYSVLAECRCGVRKSVNCGNLRRGITKSCGCYRAVSNTSRSTHGDSKRSGTAPLYMTWNNMRRRCYNPRDRAYKNYGGRGIKICDEWSTYPLFKAWAEANGYNPSLTIERKDVNGDYCPENCEWIPAPDQAKNRRTTRYITAFGETKPLWAWVEDPRCLLTRNKVAQRLDAGWTPEQAMTTPMRAGNYRRTGRPRKTP